MLRITAQTSAEAAVSYFREQFRQTDYYTEGRQVKGVWFGKGAEQLGLAGEIDEAAYQNLCHNLLPDKSGPLTALSRDGRRVGYDFTFSCPKSISLQYALCGDEQVLEIFQEALRETMREIERDMKTRVRRGGLDEDRVTGNILAAEFIHSTTRPVHGIPDPHLHAHVFVFNATYDEVEKRWKAGQFGDLKGDGRYYEARFEARVAVALARHGVAIERRGDGWEIAGFHPAVIREFSRRTEEIDREAKRLGITNADAKAGIGARLRSSKRDTKAWKIVDKDWKERYERHGSPAAVRGDSRNAVTPAEAVAFAVESEFERNSVVSERRIVEAALRRGMGSISPEQADEALRQHPDLIRREVAGERLMTTDAVLKQEQEVLDWARDGLNQCAPIKPGHVPVDQRLSADQRAALRHLLESTDRVTIVRGLAGTGKTTMMKEAVATMRSTERTVTVLAPSSEASRDELRREGFTEADTVARFLQDDRMQAEASGGVILVDEAGQVGMEDMHKLFAIAKEAKARVQLVGDTNQHAPVARGDALRLLEDHAGVRPAQLTDIRRQRPVEFRAAVRDLADGQASEGLTKLDAMGAILEFDDPAKRIAAVSEKYTESIQADKTVLVIAPTHAEGRVVSEQIRGDLKRAGIVQGEERAFERLDRTNWTTAEQRDAARYEPGMVIQFHRATSGFRSGERVTVRGVDDHGQLIVHARKTDLTLPLKAAPCFSVYRKQEFKIAAGERLRITGRGSSLDGRGLNSGGYQTVAGFTPEGHVKMTDGKVLKSGFGHWSYGYVSTSHASQSKTVDRVLISQPASSFGAASRQQLYVSISRARELVYLFTDSKAELFRMAERTSARQSATELVQHRLSPGVEHQLQVQRQQLEANRRNDLKERIITKRVAQHRTPQIIRERGRAR